MSADLPDSNGSTPRLATKEDWLERHRAIGRAQERYLWVLVVLAIFYAALHVRVVSSDSTVDGPLTVPFLGLELEAAVVWAAGPFLLSFVQLAFFGALRAYERSGKVLGLHGDDVPHEGREGLDLSPNALELAVYTTPNSPKWLRKLLYLTYPVLMVMILLEAGWIGLVVLSENGLPSWPSGFVLAAAPLWVGAAYQVLWLHAIGRLRRLKTKKF